MLKTNMNYDIIQNEGSTKRTVYMIVETNDYKAEKKQGRGV